MGKVIGRMVDGKFVTTQPETAESRKRGKRRMAEIFAARQAPGFSGSDDKFLNSFGSLNKQFGEDHARIICQEAEKHGYKPGANDVYMPTVARFTGDPDAFFSGGNARAKLKKTIEKNFGTESDGWVNTKQTCHNEPSRLPKPGLAEDLVEQVYADEVKANPELALKKAETKAAIREKHGRNKSNSMIEVPS